MFVFPSGWMGIFGWIVAVIIWAALLKQKMPGKLLWLSAVTMILINIFLTHYFYYNLLEYQAGSQTGKFLHAHRAEHNKFVAASIQDPLACIDFYAQTITHRTKDIPAGLTKGTYVLTEVTGLVQLNATQTPFRIMKKARYFKVSELTPDFLNLKTRDKATTPYYIVQIQ